jgi:predicted GNAT family N-acyltransferase
MRFEWIEEFDRAKREELFEFYKKEWWTEGRKFEDVMHMLDHSELCIGCCTAEGKLVGFARVLSDLTFKALIFDVIVHSEFRGFGIGRELIGRILVHAKLAKVSTFELYCPDQLLPFYSSLGFSKRSSHLLSKNRDN